MASSTRITLNGSTPTLIFSGVGTVFVAAASGSSSPVVLGGSGMVVADGFNAQAGPIHVSSPDEIYAMCIPGYAADAIVFHTR